jgi:hypothetical protein
MTIQTWVLFLQHFTFAPALQPWAMQYHGPEEGIDSLHTPRLTSLCGTTTS